MPAPQRVAIYIRWSTEDQGQGHTLEIQRESCRYYCLAQGWEVPEERIFIDDGYSGGDLDRPAMARLRAAVAGGQVDCVVVYRLDRLSRNIRDIINLVLGEWEDTCCVRSTQEPVDTTSDAGRLLLTLLGSFADFERSTIRTRTFSGKRKNAQKARNPGMPYAFGYQRGDQAGQYVVQAAEAAVVAAVFEWYVRGHSCRWIAAELNARGLRTRRGCRWYDADISRLLRNPLYMGRLEYNRRTWTQRRKGGQVRGNAPGEVVAVDGAVPPIVSPALWAAAQAARRRRQGVRHGGAAAAGASRHLLSGLARCGCGHALVGQAGKDPRHAYYQCAAARAGGRGACGSRGIRQRELDSVVRTALLGHHAPKPPFSPLLLRGFQEQAERRRLMAAALQARERELRAAVQRYKADYRAGRLAAGLCSELVAEARQELADLDRRRAGAAAGAGEGCQAGPDPDRARQVYAQMDPWTVLTAPERKQVLRLLVASVQASLDPEQHVLRVEVAWRVRTPADGGGPATV